MENLAKKVKSDFPFFENNPGVVFLDSAATSLTPKPVIDAVRRYYEQYSVNIHRGVYKSSMEATDIYEKTRETIKRFIGAEQGYEVIYVRNTSEGFNLLSVVLERLSENPGEQYGAWSNGTGLGKGDVVVVSESEHHSNIVPWQMLSRRTGAEVEFIPVTVDGELDHTALEQLEQKVAGKNVKVVSLSKVSNVTGVVHDLTPFKEFARKKGAMFFVDGAQAICHEKIDLKEMDADAFVFSAHKMVGPTGIGAIVLRSDLARVLPPFMGGGDMILEVYKDKTIYNEPPHKFEAGTPHIAGVFGLQAAIEYLEKVGVENILAWEKELLYATLEKLEKIEGVHIYGPSLERLKNGEVEKVGVVSFNIKGAHPHDVGTIMDENNVCIRAGHHCCQLLMQCWNVDATSRASFYLYNDMGDVDKLIESVSAVQKIFTR